MRFKVGCLGIIFFPGLICSKLHKKNGGTELVTVQASQSKERKTSLEEKEELKRFVEELNVILEEFEKMSFGRTRPRKSSLLHTQANVKRYLPV